LVFGVFWTHLDLKFKEVTPHPPPSSPPHLPRVFAPEPKFLNVYGAQELIPRNELCQPIYLKLKISKSPWGLGTEKEKGYCTCPPGYIGLRNSFLGIDFWVP
jgi:hypothetical protein